MCCPHFLECVGPWTSLLCCSSAARRLRAGIKAERESNKRREMDGSESTEKDLANVNTNGFEVRVVPERYGADREIVLAAVKQNGHKLIYAAEECRREGDNDVRVRLSSVMG
eukprot:1791007-Amphidinium_carterae.1